MASCQLEGNLALQPHSLRPTDTVSIIELKTFFCSDWSHRVPSTNPILHNPPIQCTFPARLHLVGRWCTKRTHDNIQERLNDYWGWWPTLTVLSMTWQDLQLKSLSTINMIHCGLNQKWIDGTRCNGGMFVDKSIHHRSVIETSPNKRHRKPYSSMCASTKPFMNIPICY